LSEEDQKPYKIYMEVLIKECKEAVKIHVFWDVMLDLDCLTLKMEALQTFKSSGTTHPVTQHQTPQDWNHQQHCCDILKPKESYVKPLHCSSEVYFVRVAVLCWPTD
jgi:hypothetical protein